MAPLADPETESVCLREEEEKEEEEEEEKEEEEEEEEEGGLWCLAEDVSLLHDLPSERAEICVEKEEMTNTFVPLSDVHRFFLLFLQDVQN